MNAASRMPATETPAVAIATSRREFSIDPPPPPPHRLSRLNAPHHTAATWLARHISTATCRGIGSQIFRVLRGFGTVWALRALAATLCSPARRCVVGGSPRCAMVSVPAFGELVNPLHMNA
jgi:hypothetical protein